MLDVKLIQALYVLQSQTEGSLQQQIISMEDERLRYEECSKQSLQKVLDEQLAAKQELSVVQVGYQVWCFYYDTVDCMKLGESTNCGVTCEGHRFIYFFCVKWNPNRFE